MASSGSASTPDASVSSFVSTLIVNFIIFVVYVSIFIILRKKQKRVYEPRTTVDTLPEDLKPTELPQGKLAWVKDLWSKKESFFIQQLGADGYFFMRFLMEFGIICFIGACITWPILFSLNASNSNHQQGFNMLAFGNVKDKNRYYGHIFVSWVFFGFVVFLIYRELIYYTTFRHVLQTTPYYNSLLSSRTMLLTEIPEKYLDEENLRGEFPTAKNVWYARDYEKLQNLVKERTKLAKKYEGAVNGVLTKAVKLRNKAVKKGKPVPEPSDDLNAYLKDGKKRPTHKLKFLIGKKVDTLNYGVERIGELNKEIKEEQINHTTKYEKVPSVFIEFPSQLELQKAYQAIPYHPEMKKSRRFTGVAPDDIVWDNLSLTTHKRLVKKLLANTFLTLMIIFWCIPVAFVGAVSNLTALTDKVHFLRFILNLPKFLLGLVNGLLPTVLLAVLMALVPPIIKFAGKFSGLLTVQGINSYCQSWFYAFQVVNAFLVVTLASAAASSVTTIVSKPKDAMTLLGDKLPGASNFYITFLTLKGLAVPAALLFQMVALILAQFLGKILDKTPRSKWTRWITLGQPGWATIYPAYQFLAVIAMAYAMIAPLILGFTAIAYALIYIAYLYTLTYVLRPNQNDARGRNYPAALLQLFVGLYLAQLCLIALFVMKKNWACVALEAVCTAATAASHIYMKWKVLALWEVVPISAIKYASGDTTFEYPMHDQGKKEVADEGRNYWEGGNLLNENKDNETFNKGSDEGTEGNSERVGYNDIENGKPDMSVKGGATLFKRFFQPKLESFDLIRNNMPPALFNYIEYNEDFVKTAYNFSCVNDEEPHIWIARDDLGLSEIEKNRALEGGVDVHNEDAEFNEKGQIIYTGPPPSYEEALKM